MALTTGGKDAPLAATVARKARPETDAGARCSGPRAAPAERIGKNQGMPSSDSSGDGNDRDVLTSLPRTRPARRSAKRGTRAASTPEPAAPEAPADTPARARSRAAAKPKPAATPATRRAPARSKPKAARTQAAKAEPAPAEAAKPASSRAKAKPRSTGRAGTRRATTRSRSSAVRSTPASAGTATRAAESAVPPAGYAAAPAESAAGRPGPDPFAVVGTAVQAAGEIAQIGATLWSQALRSAISRLPRP
jgi:hypothetical protein